MPIYSLPPNGYSQSAQLNDGKYPSEHTHVCDVQKANHRQYLYWHIPAYEPISSSWDDCIEIANLERKQVLIDKLEKEFKQTPQRLGGTDVTILKARVLLIATALLKLKSTYFSMGLTTDESLYGRMHLAAGKGTLHIELLLGEDAQDEADAFVTLYKKEQQLWSLAGDFKTVLLKMKEQLGVA